MSKTIMESIFSTGKNKDDSRFYCGDISTYSQNWFHNRSFICGDSTIKLFTKLLNLPKNNQFVLDAINWKRHYFEINLSGKRTKKTFKLVAKQYKKGEQWLYKKYQSIVLQNKFIILFKRNNLKGHPREILSIFSDNLSNVKPYDLFNIVYNDNNKFIEELRQADLSDKDAKSSCSSYYDWGNKKMGQTFMLTYNLIDQIPWVNFDKSGLLLRCGDIECDNIYHPFYFFTYFPLTFNAYQGVSRREREKENDFEEIAENNDLFRKTILASAVVELKDEDIILGCDSKIEGILKRLSQNKNIPLQVISTCTSKIIGSDIDSLIKKISKKNDIQILYEHNLGRQPLEEFENLMENSLKTKNNKAESKTINLIGFENDYAIKELAETLKRLFGIKLNITCLPEVNVSSLKNFYKARLHVLNNLEVYNSTFDNLFGRLDIDTIKLSPPYGIKQTLKWLISITKFFKISIDKNRGWKEYCNEIMLEWERLTKEANKFRLGLIVSDENIESLIKPVKYPFGIPLLKCLEEMGFGLNILFTSQENFDNQKKIILDLFKNKKKHKIELLNNQNKLEEWISTTDCNCIYSDFRNDMRIFLNGKTAFSLFLFEKGFDGAIRTLKELLKLCKISLFSSYKKSGKMQLKPIILE